MFAEYCCIYGISNPIKGMNKGEGDFVLNDLFSHLVVTSKGGRNYWFLFKKLDRKYYVPNIPRFTAEDTERLAVELGHTHIHPDVPFSKLWEERVCATMTPLEENVFRTWHFGRIVCLGDAMHKVSLHLPLTYPLFSPSLSFFYLY